MNSLSPAPALKNNEIRAPEGKECTKTGSLPLLNGLWGPGIAGWEAAAEGSRLLSPRAEGPEGEEWPQITPKVLGLRRHSHAGSRRLGFPAGAKGGQKSERIFGCTRKAAPPLATLKRPALPQAGGLHNPKDLMFFPRVSIRQTFKTSISPSPFSKDGGSFPDRCSGSHVTPQKQNHTVLYESRRIFYLQQQGAKAGLTAGSSTHAPAPIPL